MQREHHELCSSELSFGSDTNCYLVQPLMSLQDWCLALYRPNLSLGKKFGVAQLGEKRNMIMDA